MTRESGVPSVRDIRAALEEIPGAMLDDPPLPEHVGGGDDPSTPVWTYDPDRAADYAETLDFPPADDNSDDTLPDEPAVIFEVPPTLSDADIARVLGEEPIRDLDRFQQIQGIDARGWYITFHQRKVQHAIHIPFEGVLWLAWHAFGHLPLPWGRKAELAFHAILRHELFHFEADCMTANWEMVTGVEVYWNARGHRNDAGYIEQEEALANAYMLRGFKHLTRLLANSAGAYSALRRFCERQPAGYKDGPAYAKTRGVYLGECGYLSGIYHEVSKVDWEASHAFDTLMLYPDPVRIDWTRCPIIFTDRHNLQGLLGIHVSFFSTVTAIEETAPFQKALKKLDKKRQRLWATRKEQLAQSTALKSLEFKQWEKAGRDWYSVRVDGNYRVHLRHDRAASMWFAEKIGDHKAMGHG
jgi:plasmid maintenance system killer protein